MMKWLVIFCILAVLRGAATTSQGGKSSGALQVIRRLGENRAGALKVSQGRSRSGESPIYFIKLPPTPYFYLQNVVSNFGDPHHKVPVDFINNGRPNQVYHWNLPIVNSPMANPPPPSFSQTIAPAAAVFPTIPHAQTPILTPVVPSMPLSYPTQPLVVPQTPARMGEHGPSPPVSSGLLSGNPSASHSKKTWVTSKKQFSYNGRPSGIYIFKSKRPTNKYVRPLGKLLNH